jgi:hypothetical protein
MLSFPRPPVNDGGAPSSADNIENPSSGPMAIIPTSQPNQPPITPPPSVGTVPIPPSPSPTRFREETLTPPEDEEPPSGSPPTGHAPMAAMNNLGVIYHQLEDRETATKFFPTFAHDRHAFGRLWGSGSLLCWCARWLSSQCDQSRFGVVMCRARRLRIGSLLLSL